MAGKKQKQAVPLNEIGFGTAFVSGNIVTKLSAVIFGLGNILHKQIIRGLLLLSLEIAYILFLVSFGFKAIGKFTSLGTVLQREVFNETKQLYEYAPGDNSMLCLLYGVVTFFVIFLFIATLSSSVKSAYNTQLKIKQGKAVPSFLDDLHSLKQQNLHKALLFLPIIGVLTFTVIPLIYMIFIAFTNYDNNHQPPGNLFNWVGMDNFVKMFQWGGDLSRTLWPVLTWTIIWAFVATFLNFILGIILTLVINRPGTKAKGFWRFLFILSIAVPQFVSLLTMSAIFNTNGPINSVLRSAGLIQGSIPFLTDPLLAKITIIVVNIWIGVPYTMLNTTGILQNIPSDLYEAAKVDGANAVVTFFKITLPYMLFIMTPYLITQFAGNINNFNVIYLLTGGGPESMEYYYAGKTDLLITWLFKLTVSNKMYCLGSVIGIIVFVVLATTTLLTYRHSGSYKDEEAFQ